MVIHTVLLLAVCGSEEDRELEFGERPTTKVVWASGLSQNEVELATSLQRDTCVPVQLASPGETFLHPEPRLAQMKSLSWPLPGCPPTRARASRTKEAPQLLNGDEPSLSWRLFCSTNRGTKKYAPRKEKCVIGAPGHTHPTSVPR